MKSIEVSGKNVDQAIEIGLFKMGEKRENVNVIILDEGGLFSKAKVKLVLNSELEKKTEIENIVEDFFKSTGLNIYASVEESDEKILINISGSDVGTLIGKHGDVLDSIQFILQQIIFKNKSHDEFKRIIVDSEGYRGKREETLKNLAIRIANQAVKEGKVVKLEPMPANERRIIHTSLQSRSDIETVSQGTEPNRYLTIIPLNKKNKNKNNTYNDNRDFND